jgi:hypothetical protein
MSLSSDRARARGGPSAFRRSRRMLWRVLRAVLMGAAAFGPPARARQTRPRRRQPSNTTSSRNFTLQRPTAAFTTSPFG